MQLSVFSRSRWRAFVSTIILSMALLEPASADKSAVDYFVDSLPGQPEGPLIKMHAGHVEVAPEINGNLFFWHFQNKHIADIQRTVIWLNGGPGCSSMDGALMEIGPYRVGDDDRLEYNDGSWNMFANLLFVDNPIGTGFSYVDTNSYLHELREMADQFVIFLEKWFAMFPEYLADDIYITGESYAGQHIPYIARAILDRNKIAGNQPWKIQGLVIGNGWIAPTEQYLSYLQYVYKLGLIQEGSHDAKILENQQAICVKALDNYGSKHVSTPECEEILQMILKVSSEGSGDSVKCLNMYDVRLSDTYPECGMNWPPDLIRVKPYLRRSDVTSALNVDPDKKTGWVECNSQVGHAFSAKKSSPSITLLPDLLNEVPVLLFSGNMDLICNHLGTEDFLAEMEWNNGKGFEISPGVWAPQQDWIYDGDAAGIYRQARNLTYVVFYNASHMVPFDFPRRTRDMLNRFMHVQIDDIQGHPGHSIIGGEIDPLVSVGGYSSSSSEAEPQDKSIKLWDLYAYVGIVVVLIILLIFMAFGWRFWRKRRRNVRYQGILSEDQRNNQSTSVRESLIRGMELENVDNKHDSPDLEAAAAFDENELDDYSDSGRT